MSMSTRMSVTFSVIGNYISLALQFASTMILARLLTPEEIGIYGAGFSVVALAHLFRDFGLTQYLIQEKNLDQQKINATFTLSLLIAWTLAATIFFISGLVSTFFNEPDIEPLLKLLSINFLAIPFGSITMALLRKELQFHITSSIGIVATLIGISVTLWAAYSGHRYFSLAYGAITETSMVVIISTLFRPKEYKIKLGLEGARRVFNFGSIVGIGNIINQFSTSATDALVARMLGLSALGFFSRAFGTFSLFENIFVRSIRPTVLPLFSKHNDDLGKFTQNYLTTVAYSLILAWPFFGFLFFQTDIVIQTLYGDQWDKAIPLVKVLCFAGFLLPPILFTENLFVAMGRPEVTLKIQAISNISKFIFVIIACFVSLKAVCIAITGFFLVKLVSSLFYMKKMLNLHLVQFITLAKDALPCTFLSILFPLVTSFYTHSFIKNMLINFSLLASMTFLGWLLGLIVSKHTFYRELKILVHHLAHFGKTK